MRATANWMLVFMFVSFGLGWAGGWFWATDHNDGDVRSTGL